VNDAVGTAADDGLMASAPGRGDCRPAPPAVGGRPDARHRRVRHRFARGAAAALGLVLVAASPAIADDWPAPRIASVFSEDGRRFVRVIPGTSVGDTVGFAGAPKGAPARGEFYVRQDDRSYRLVADVALANPVAPVAVLVSNTGHLVTFDNWHNAGYGTVVAIYDPSGRMLKMWRLEDLYPASRLADIPMSVSSRWWRCTPAGFVDPPTQRQVYVRERLGGTFVLTLATGAVTYAPGRGPCAEPAGPFSATVPR